MRRQQTPAYAGMETARKCLGWHQPLREE